MPKELNLNNGISKVKEKTILLVPLLFTLSLLCSTLPLYIAPPQARCDTAERRAIACNSLASLLAESELASDIAGTEVLHAVSACLADDSLLVAAEAMVCAR